VKKLGLAGILFSSLALQAATIIDLTTANATSTQTAALGGSFTVTQIQPQSTGTGVIDSFLRVDSNATSEQGYNTSLGTPLDDKGGVFTRALSLSEIPIVTIGGIAYRQFLLDINQTNNSPLLSLNQIQIFQAGTDINNGVVNSAGTYPVIGFSGATQIFEMSAGSGSPQYTIQMNYSLNPGSGAGDMFLYVRNADFSTSLNNVILYSQFGLPPGTSSTNDGFEEWAVLKPSGSTCTGDCTVNTPEPQSILLLGSLFLGVGQLFRRRFSATPA
jgi:hypothetical protein